MKRPKPQHSDLEDALRGLGLAIKAVRFYPEGHPARDEAVKRGASLFQRALTGHDHLALVVRKEQLSIENGPPLRTDNPALRALAHHLFARRVQQLLILPDILPEDLERAACSLALEPEEIIRRGGIARILKLSGVETLWVNETDLQKVFNQREQVQGEATDLLSTADRAKPQVEEKQGDDISSQALDEQDEQYAPPAVDPELYNQRRSLTQILEDLAQEGSDTRFRRLIQELIEGIHAEETSTLPAEVLKALSFLARTTHATEVKEERRALCHTTFDKLMTTKRLDQLIEMLCNPNFRDEERKEVHFLLKQSEEKGAMRLTAWLAEEPVAKRRKIIAQALARFGRTALGALDRLLRDERWYVVRNVATILGEIRDPETADRLAILLGHNDERVQREAIRALTRLGTTEAMEVLLVAVEEGDPGLQRQALLFLGAMKQTKAIPYLLRFVRRPDIFMRRHELKRGAVRALGEMGALEAVPDIAALLNRRKIIFRRRHQEIQTACCLALARIGTEKSRQILEIAAQRGQGAVSRSAARALRELSRSERI